ncbi:histidine phosphatase family protein [Neobacillus novalis]|uniref:Histidine phosphatase family protein n=1 Tax=Neobacillus novalis TaxID=220687 RepID=A0AA95S6M5_9BACI|nr:histidine phosphatase family protein [Neobacillus novalis]WHY83850.1 histidine phosphatase family protein [Neobacillus novalis]
MQLTLIRHLPTEWNKQQKLQGRRDIEISFLTEEFQKGMDANQQVLQGLSPFDVVLASTLKRTQQTACLYGYKCEPEYLLDELDFGHFEGLPKEKLMLDFGEKWMNHPKELVLGESICNLEARIALFLEKYQGFRNILVFGHGSWIRAMISYHKYGHINQMNKIVVENNACITLSTK